MYSKHVNCAHTMEPTRLELEMAAKREGKEGQLRQRVDGWLDWKWIKKKITTVTTTTAKKEKEKNDNADDIDSNSNSNKNSMVLKTQIDTHCNIPIYVFHSTE